jgi:hypothetical protein
LTDKSDEEVGGLVDSNVGKKILGKMGWEAGAIFIYLFSTPHTNIVSQEFLWGVKEV